MKLESGIAIEECRAALEKTLDDEIFFGSRRLSDFCRYCGNVALEGRTDLDQYEIASKVLGRTTDFNPLDDAAVRKLATQLRHKLEAYYAGPGQSDLIVISMPRRSYLLRFRRRGTEEPVADTPVEDVDPPSVEPEPESLSATPAERTVLPPDTVARVPWKRVLAGLSFAVICFLAWQLLGKSWDYGGSLAATRGKFSPVTIDTRRGDLRGKQLDTAADAVRTGSNLGEGEDATVRLRFTPEFPGQQAGLMVLYDVDNFVRVGQHHKDRALMEFGMEREGSYQQHSSAYEFDPLGQAGQSRWLTLRRAGPDYTAYISADGLSWRQFGSKFTLPDTSGDLKTAVYAFNGKTVNPASHAVFEHFGVGLSFHNRPEGGFEVAAFPGWHIQEGCKSAAAPRVTAGVLEVNIAADALGCNWSLMRGAPSGDWAISTLVDFEAVSGSGFGLVVRGSKGSAGLIRRDLGGRSLLLERTDDNDTRLPDFPGTPPLVLRMEKGGGVLRASFSRDLETYTVLPVEVKLDEIGAVKEIGLVASIAHWTSKVTRPPARIYWVRVEANPPGFLPRQNVP